MQQLPQDQLQNIEEPEMSFLDHLEELRWHVIRAFAAITLCTVVAFVSKDFVFGTLIFGPTTPDFWTFQMLCQLSDILHSEALCIDSIPFNAQSRLMTGQFTMHITASFALGIIVAFPYAFWEIWRFISPGLYIKERKVARGAVFYVSLLFIIGVMFGYYIITPLTVNFLSSYQVHASVLNEFDIVSYVSTITTLVLACGLLFQLPMVVYFLTKAGLLTPDIMKNYRKHGIVAIFLLGAMLTPPDPFSQILIAIPLIGLYQFSIAISNRTYKNISRDLN
ncbi:MAG: twin-arginine translocase subunit TatC [Reichenbachiella sp.]|uniref:twin-arginine translocase subunit TatC n=1 Tax=Reichenbachiella sp. TaxID=2184521 RepID=UPI0032635596